MGFSKLGGRNAIQKKSKNKQFLFIFLF
jgi:hypothetical protein